MWKIFILIAVLLQGAYCTPIIKTANRSCTIEIKRFDEPVTTLEVKWGSTIRLVCDASCAGPGPQPGLSWWYYRTQTKLINIEKLFRPPKFETYPTAFHRMNQLVIRNFGPNEERKFICRGSIKNQKWEAEVQLHGTDCLQKYEFRCKVDKRCIDRGYLCNKNDECPDGEDEVGCDITTTLSTTRKSETVGEGTVDYEDITETVPTSRIPETSVETMRTTEKKTSVETMRTTEKKTSVETMRTTTKKFVDICPEGKQACRNQSECFDSSRRCDGLQDCADNSDEMDCPSIIGIICPEGKLACRNSSKCINDFQRCDRVVDCTNGEDEEGCPTEKEKIRTMGPDIDSVVVVVTDSAADFSSSTVEFTDFTTPFDFEAYVDYK